MYQLQVNDIFTVVKSIEFSYRKKEYVTVLQTVDQFWGACDCNQNELTSSATHYPRETSLSTTFLAQSADSLTAVLHLLNVASCAAQAAGIPLASITLLQHCLSIHDALTAKNTSVLTYYDRVITML